MIIQSLKEDEAFTVTEGRWNKRMECIGHQANGMKAVGGFPDRRVLGLAHNIPAVLHGVDRI